MSEFNVLEAMRLSINHIMQDDEFTDIAEEQHSEDIVAPRRTDDHATVHVIATAPESMVEHENEQIDENNIREKYRRLETLQVSVNVYSSDTDISSKFSLGLFSRAAKVIFQQHDAGLMRISGVRNLTEVDRGIYKKRFQFDAFVSHVPEYEDIVETINTLTIEGSYEEGDFQKSFSTEIDL